MQSFRYLFRYVFLAGVLSTFSVTPCRAQPVLAPDDVVRVRTFSNEARRIQVVKGVVHRIEADSLVLFLRPDDDVPDRLAVKDIVDVKRSVVDGTHAGRGAALGFLGLGTVSAVLSYATYDDSFVCDPMSFCLQPSRGFETAAGFILGGLVGAVAGMFIGARKEKTRWKPVRLPASETRARLHVLTSPQNGVGFRLQF